MSTQRIRRELKLNMPVAQNHSYTTISVYDVDLMLTSKKKTYVMVGPILSVKYIQQSGSF